MLFTDGIRAWNSANTQISTSNLGGDPSASQSGIIIPIPSAPNQFFIVTQPRNRGSIRFTRFDMRTSPGVQVGTPVTIGGTANTSELLGVVSHSDGVDYWLVATESGGAGGENRVGVMRVRNIGITAPAWTDITPTINGGLGQIAFSSSGNQIAFGGSQTSPQRATVHVMDFDRCRGTLSGLETFVLPPPREA